MPPTSVSPVGPALEEEGRLSPPPPRVAALAGLGEGEWVRRELLLLRNGGLLPESAQSPSDKSSSVSACDGSL